MVPSKKQALTLTACLLLSLAAFFSTKDQAVVSPMRRLASSYTTTSTRSSSVNSYCSGLTRSTLVDSTLISQYNVFNAQMSTMFSLNGTSFFLSLLQGDSASVQTQAQNSATQFGFFVGPFILGLVLMILLSPFILCCCTCPGSCPSKCCRKRQDEQYTKCQLYWPVGTLIAALLLSIGASIAGFSQSQTFPQAINSMGCAGSIILDDLLNGNVTTDGSSFFVGLKQLDTQLGNLNANLSTIQSTMNNLVPGSANMTAVNNAGNTALTNTAKVPNNVNSGGNMPAITYNTPLYSGSPTGTTTSIFPTILGSSNTGGLVGTLYATITAVMSTISTISTAASNFISEVSNFSSAVSSARSQVQTLRDSISTMDTSFSASVGTVDQRSGQVHLGVRLLYGITIGVASMMLLGALLVAFCDKIKCRYLIYFSCVLVFILGVLGFALSVLFSVAVPTVYFGCQFMQASLSSSSSFNTTFAPLITNSTVRGYVGTCLSTSSGDLMGAIGGGTVNALGNLSSSLTTINIFNISKQSSNVLADTSSLTSYIGYYQNGVINDLNDTASTNILIYLSKQANYPGCTGIFTTDSWIPSYSQSPTYAGCQISGGNNATNTQCGGANFAAGSGGCSGCMDTTSILNTVTYTSKANVLTALNNRYTAGGCSTFNNEMANTWNNYYRIKSNAISAVATRATTATSSINQFSANLTGTLNATLTNAQNSLAAAASSVTDPKYGLIAGLNCRLIGEDLSTFTNTFCQSVFTVSYFNRLTIGCTSFGLLFAMCCGVCTGVRFYKHSIRKLNSVENEGLSEDEVQDITNTNFVKPKVLE